MHMRRLLILGTLLLAGFTPSCTAAPQPLRPAGPIRVATGNTGGVFSALGGAYVGILHRTFPRMQATAQASDGSVANVHRLISGHADVGFALGSIAGDAAIVGSTPGQHLPIVALAHLYDNYVQIVVPANSDIRTVHDLRGKRISVGSPASATAVMASRVLALAAIEQEVNTVHLDLKESARMLARGEIDAFVWGGGIPTSAITDLQAGIGVRLVDLGSIADRIVQLNGELFTKASVPASIYGLDSAVTTVSVPAYLVVPRTMPDAHAYWLTRMLFEGQRELIKAHPEGRRIDLRLAIETYPLDLHPGAQQWYRQAHR